MLNYQKKTIFAPIKTLIMSELIHIDAEYKHWIADLSLRYRKTQIKMAMKVNDEMLRFYWSLGKDMADMHIEERWGQSVMKNLSRDLQKQFPDSSGFSETNLGYISRFYRLHSQSIVNYPQVEGELTESNTAIYPQVGEQIQTSSNRPNLVDDFTLLMNIPWGHHKVIIDKVKGNAKKGMFFVRKTWANGWSRAVLLNFIETDLYEREGKAVNNFALTMPEIDSELINEITKDPYCFNFLPAGVKEKHTEAQLKKALVQDLKHFFMELGKGFGFMGEEYHIKVGQKDKYIDLLFYIVPLHRYCVIEVKTTELDFEDLGQLNGYVSSVNRYLNTDREERAIGLLICKKKDSELAQVAMDGYSNPLGIAEYEVVRKSLPEELQNTLPTIEQIENELNSKSPLPDDTSKK